MTPFDAKTTGLLARDCDCGRGVGTIGAPVVNPEKHGDGTTQDEGGGDERVTRDVALRKLKELIDRDLRRMADKIGSSLNQNRYLQEITVVTPIGGADEWMKIGEAADKVAKPLDQTLEQWLRQDAWPEWEPSRLLTDLEVR